jgi:hypothetical protein
LDGGVVSFGALAGFATGSLASDARLATKVGALASAVGLPTVELGATRFATGFRETLARGGAVPVRLADLVVVFAISLPRAGDVRRVRAPEQACGTRSATPVVLCAG